ncbi:anaerobic ribonucleoside-triphosphate reductase activating protein, partial [Candidatus Woesearchaeota archaeon CG10_big_fil_rev_8_21_14_0_10_47_5]
MEAYIGGVIPVSTVDWPGMLCSVVFLAGCDFRCPYCQNAGIIGFESKHLQRLSDIKKKLSDGRGFVDAVLFSGGEASLQRQALNNLACFAKQMGMKTGIETNGSRPFVIKSLIEDRLLDFVALDVKAPLE